MSDDKRFNGYDNIFKDNSPTRFNDIFMNLPVGC